uniref:Dopamine receptor D2b short form n=1 Tax=Oryzias latipes TaxID=8090 RepID=W0TY51_ORYLA|nr:dopamine receptor D2b short form [Oryzias latipes]
MTSLNASDDMSSLSFPISSLEKNLSSSVTYDPSSSPVSFPPPRPRPTRRGLESRFPSQLRLSFPRL